MPSYGEGRIIAWSHAVGTVRVTDLRAASTCAARLGLGLEISLQDGPQESGAPGKLWLTGLSGELRLAREEAAIASVVWHGPWQVVESGPATVEHTVNLVVQLDPWRLEEIEKRRGGGEPSMWLQLWPQIQWSGGYCRATIDLMMLQPPRDKWIEFLNAVRDTEVGITEMQVPFLAAGRFKAARSRIQEAQELIDIGQYGQAVVKCRLAIEAIGLELSGNDPNGARSFLDNASGEKKGEHYWGIVSRLKQIAAMAVHEYAGEVEFTRCDAQFIVGMTRQVIAFCADLSVSRTD